MLRVLLCGILSVLGKTQSNLQEVSLSHRIQQGETLKERLPDLVGFNAGEVDEEFFLIAHKRGERDWEWIARCFAKDPANSLSHKFTRDDEEDEERGLKYGTMKEGKLVGWGARLIVYSVEVGRFDGDLVEGVKTMGDSVYEGQFRNGKAHGIGTETLDDGTEYYGEWKKGRRHGLITCTFNGGRMGSVFIEDSRNGFSKLAMDDSYCCEGLFEGDLPKGWLWIGSDISDRDLFVLPRVRECLAQGLCTNTLGEMRIPQIFATCEDSIDICKACAESCHSGHNLSEEEKFMVGWCECGNDCTRRKTVPPLKKAKLG